MNYESISDDALFGSGTDSWNVNTRSSPRLPEQIGEETENIMTLRNHDDSKNRYDRQSNGRSQHDQVRPQHERSPQSSCNGLHAVYDPSDLFTVRPDPTRLPGHSGTPSGAAIPTDKGARAKVLKNKENKSKNNTKRTQIVKNGENRIGENRENRIGENRVVPRQFRAFNDLTEWQPVLQYKQYEDDNEETDLLKPVNNSKNSKKHKNKNAPKSAPLPSIPRLPSTGSISDNDMLSLQSIPMPAGLSPSSRPQDFVHHIYLKDNNQLQQNGLELANSATDIGQPLSSENQADSLLSVSAGTSKPQNVTPIYNNLWEGRGKKQSNEDSMSSMINLNTNNEGIHLVNNDLEVDLAPHQQVSGSRLEHPIVVPYQTQNRHTLRMENIQCNGETSQSENVPSMNFNSSSNLTNSLPSSFLVDEYNDSVLFGDGYDKDFLLAQKLQQEFDRENEEFQHQRQYDLPSSVQRQFNPANEQPINSLRNDIHVTQPLSSENAEPSGNWPSIENSLNTLDYQTALLPSFEDSLTNEQDPVYVPEEIVSPLQPSEPIVIAIENESRGDNENRPQEETGRVHEPLVVTIPFDREQLQNDEHYPQTVSVRENIHIPYEESGAGGLVARSDSPPQLPDRYRNNDERYARLVQERQDEELARQLQEEDERRSNLVGRNNPRFYHQYRRPRNSEPLRQRFSDTWTRRPLIVSSGALNDNVADSQVRRPNTSSERPLVTGNGNEFSYLDNVHSIPIAGYDIPPGHDYYYRYENDPDLMLDEHGEDRLISINRDPQLLATLLMTRDPDMMIPNDVDLNDYEALWELAENLGEVRRVGMDQKDISLLPVHVHESTKKQNTDDNSFDCLVCLSEFKSGERLRTLPCCHVYHVDCIDEWLKRNAVCPVCRRSAKQDHSQQH